MIKPIVRRLPYGNCPYCDEGSGVTGQGWGMSPEGWAQMREAHEAGHPKVPPKWQQEWDNRLIDLPKRGKTQR